MTTFDVPARPMTAERRREKRRNVALLLLAAVALLGVLLYRHFTRTASTTDAQVESRAIGVSPGIAGRVRAVHVRDNQTVEAGQLLLEIESDELTTEIQLLEAERAGASAALRAARAQAGLTERGARASMAQARGGVLQAGYGLRAVNAASKQAEQELNAARERRLQLESAHASARDASSDAPLAMGEDTARSATPEPSQTPAVQVLQPEAAQPTPAQPRTLQVLASDAAREALANGRAVKLVASDAGAGQVPADGRTVQVVVSDATRQALAQGRSVRVVARDAGVPVAPTASAPARAQMAPAAVSPGTFAASPMRAAPQRPAAASAPSATPPADDAVAKALADARAAEARAEMQLVSATAHRSTSWGSIVAARGRFDEASGVAEQIEVARANVELAEANLAQADARLKLAQRGLASGMIRAPRKGTVRQLVAEVGQLVAADKVLFSLIASDDSWIAAIFEEKQLSKIKPGQVAEVTADALDGRAFKARVESIASPTKVLLRLDDPADKEVLRPGMGADVSVVLREKF